MLQASIIIRTRNEERHVGEVLARVRDQRRIAFEVIVVDSGSTDATLSIVRKVPDIRLIEIPASSFTYGRALNIGMREAKAPILVSLSAHAVPFDRDWLANLLKPFDDPDVCAVVGKPLPHPDCNPFDRRGLLRRYGTERLYLHVDSPIMYQNANGAIRRADWDALPFDENLPYSEDLAWARERLSAGRRIVYEPSAAVYHSHNETFDELYSRFYNESAARVRIGAGVERYRVSRLMWDVFAGGAYDKWTALRRVSNWRHLLDAPKRRIAINLGRYAGSRGIPKLNPPRPGRQILLRAGLVVFDKISANLQRLAPHVVKITRKHIEAIHPKHLLRENKEHYWYDAHLRGARRVLDIGCNQGMHSINAAAHAQEVVGIDRDEQLLYVANFNAKWDGRKNVIFVAADADKLLPFADASFDVVMAFDVIEHLDERQLFLSEIRRVLVPGGTLLLSAPNSETGYKRLKKMAGLRYYCDPTHVIEYTLDELRDECRRGGFTDREVAPVVIDSPFYGFFDFLGAFSLPLYERFEQYKRTAVKHRPQDTTGFRMVLTRAGDDARAPAAG